MRHDKNSVAPIEINGELERYRLLKTSIKSPEASGHDFSRAEKSMIIKVGL